MVIVHIPATMRAVTAGERMVSVEGGNLGEVIANLDALYPGLQSRLTEGERLRAGLAIFVNGVNVSRLLQTKIPSESEIYFAPALSGG